MAERLGCVAVDRDRVSNMRALLLLSTAAALCAVPALGRAAEAPRQTAQAEQGVRFQIPAQELDTALTAFADQAGLRLLFASRDLAGLRTAGLSGTLTPAQGLRQLLSGTGYTWRFSDARTVVLEKVAAAPGVVVTDPVSVEGRRSSRDPGATEGSGSYGGSVTTVGSKMPTTLRETPQSVSVVTRQRIDDQNLNRLEDAMRATTGMTVLTNDQGRSSIFTRGYELDNALVDGLPAPLSSVYGTQPDLVMFDRIEVLRGPSGMLFGTGEPGGTVNLVRKRAQDRFTATGSATIGSWEYRRAEVDVGGPLTEAGRVRGRLVGAFQDRDTHVNVNHNRTKVGYGTVDVDLTENTTLSLSAARQEAAVNPFNGLPAYASGQLLDVDRSTFIGADWNRFKNDITDGFAELEHRFEGGGRARAAVRYSDRDVDFKYAYSRSAVDPRTNTTGLTVLARQYWEESLSADANVSLPFSLLGQTHTVLAGVDYRRYQQKLYQGQANFGPAINVYNPISNVAEPATPFTTRTENEPIQYSAYGQLRLKPVSPLTVLLGGRLSRYENTSTNLVNGAVTTFTEEGKFTPYAGLILDLTDTVSAYASYTDIFQPQTATGANGAVLRPRTGTQYETGLKGEFLGGALNAHAALFRLTDENRAIADATRPTVSIAAGKVRVQGFEAEVSGTVMPGWEVFAGYAYTQTEYLTAPPGQSGTFNTWTPKHSATLWTRYTFQDGPLDGFHVGGGLRAYSGYFAQSGAVRFEQGGYTVADAQIGYQVTKAVGVALSVNNLFDTKYYSRVGGPTVFNFYGEPRSAWLKLTAKF
ncbi:TonB-dependent siderophore receptor [Azospirillum sp.]|uniref:TonB-dependent siderophore receptor n=1 Tax=Azospirillum sp. TaxID=34012 RepID=UPI003D7068FE